MWTNFLFISSDRFWRLFLNSKFNSRQKELIWNGSKRHQGGVLHGPTSVRRCGSLQLSERLARDGGTEMDPRTSGHSLKWTWGDWMLIAELDPVQGPGQSLELCRFLPVSVIVAHNDRIGFQCVIGSLDLGDFTPAETSWGSRFLWHHLLTVRAEDSDPEADSPCAVIQMFGPQHGSMNPVLFLFSLFRWNKTEAGS